jgi:hypothetical protein
MVFSPRMLVCEQVASVHVIPPLTWKLLHAGSSSLSYHTFLALLQTTSLLKPSVSADLDSSLFPHSLVPMIHVCPACPVLCSILHVQDEHHRSRNSGRCAHSLSQEQGHGIYLPYLVFLLTASNMSCYKYSRCYSVRLWYTHYLTQPMCKYFIERKFYIKILVSIKYISDLEFTGWCWGTEDEVMMWSVSVGSLMSICLHLQKNELLKSPLWDWD